MQKASIIIPNRNGLSYLQLCIQSIKQHTDMPYEIIVVDNGSQDDSLEYCRYEQVRLISVPFNCGFPAACNMGMRVASGDAIMLLNNDVVVTPNWLSNMMRCLYSVEDVGIVGPVTNYVSGIQKVDSPYNTPQGAAIAPNVPDSGKWQDVSRLVGFCFMFKREVMQRIGLLDEIFTPGHYEDDDFCYRTRLAGYRLLISGDTFVFHHGSASFEKEGEERLKALIQTNYEKFIHKWGFDPHSLIQ